MGGEGNQAEHKYSMQSSKKKIVQSGQVIYEDNR